MSTNIRYPNITAADEKGQLLQVKSYLHQLVEQLNWALQSVEGGSKASTVTANSKEEPGTKPTEIPPDTFSALKSLIIKSADIVNAYYEEINSRLEGIYIAESDFGTYFEESAQEITQTSKYTLQMFSYLQTIVDEISTRTDGVDAYIKTGQLYEDDNIGAVYGVEIGQRSTRNGAETFSKFSRFTAGKLSFYDQNGFEAAYISDRKLFINIVQVNKTLSLGRFMNSVESDGVWTYWV